MRKYSLDNKYFSEINSEIKAYILGFLFADGNIKHDGFVVRFLIHNKDIEILELIKNELNYSGPIKLVRERYILLELNSVDLVKDLAKYGAYKNKSLTLKPPKGLNSEFIPAFIRGYFDGDGCVAIYNKGTYMKPFIAIRGTQEMLNWIQSNLNTTYKLTKAKESEIYLLNFSKLETVYNFSKYVSFKFALKRKSILLDKCAAYCEQSNRLKNLNNGESLSPDKVTTVAST